MVSDLYITVTSEWLTVTLMATITFGALAAMASVLARPSSARS